MLTTSYSGILEPLLLLTNISASLPPDLNQLVERFITDQSDLIDNIITDNPDLTPRQLGRKIKDSIGMNQRDYNAVERYRQELSGDFPSRSALNRGLINRRYNRAIRAANVSRRPLPNSLINTIVSDYRTNLVRHRSRTIARTEAQTDLNAALNATYQTALDRGDIQGTVEKQWVTAADERVRSSHRTLHLVTIAQNAAFITGAGNTMRYPGDLNAPISERANCRCRNRRIIRTEE